MFIYKKCSCRYAPHKKNNLSEFRDVARKMKLLSAPSRIALLSILYKSPHCVSDLETHTGLSQTLISHHLKALTENKFVRSAKEGAFIRYYLTPYGRKLVGFVKTVK